MTLKEIEQSTTNVVDTGHFIYIGFKEEWKHGKYHGCSTREYVSTLGRIYDPIKESIMELKAIIPKGRTIPRISYSFHVITGMYSGTIRNIPVSRVVLETFKGPPPKNMIRPECDHIIPNTLDNSIDNLQWLSGKENTQKSNLNEGNPNAKYTSEQVYKICDLLDENALSIQEIADLVGVEKTFVFDLKYQRAWQNITKQYDFSNYNVFGGSYDQEVSKQIKQLVIDGKSNEEIITTLNLPRSKQTSQVLSAHRKRQNKTLRKKTNYPKEMITAIDNAIIEGKTTNEIFDIIGVKTKQLATLISVHRFNYNKKSKTK